MAEPEYWDSPDTLTHKVRDQIIFWISIQPSPQVSLDVYRRESIKIHAKFKEILPDAEIGFYIDVFAPGHPLTMMLQSELRLTRLFST